MPEWKTPRPLGNLYEVDKRKRPNQLYASHVEELNKLVERIRESKPGDDSVPWFDPAGAGVNARVLILQQDPSEVAEKGTGFISPDNPDRTADNTTLFRNKAKLRPEELTHWNIVPWVIGERGATFEINKAIPYLRELLELLAGLEVVICMGKTAEEGWNYAYPDNQCLSGWIALPDNISNRPIILTCPHPSFQSVEGKHKLIDGLTPSERIEKTFHKVRIILDEKSG